MIDDAEYSPLCGITVGNASGQESKVLPNGQTIRMGSTIVGRHYRLGAVRGRVIGWHEGNGVLVDCIDGHPDYLELHDREIDQVTDPAGSPASGTTSRGSRFRLGWFAAFRGYRGE